MKHMTQILLSAVFILGAIFFYDSIFVSPIRQENKRNKETLAWYDTTFLQKQGWTSFIGGDKGTQYDLRSWDGGQTWYAVQTTESDSSKRKLVVLGEVETVYPNLMSHLDGWDALTAHVHKNGAIGSHPITNDDIKVLENAGFTVDTTKQ